MSDETLDVGMPRDLLLVRHGRSEGNEALEAAKRGDLSLMTEAFLARSAMNYRLVPEGAVQAEQAGLFIRDWMETAGFATFDRCYVSPYLRAMETAARLDLPDAMWQRESLVRERDYGNWEGLDRPQTRERYPRSSELKQRNKFLWRPECGESISDVELRVREMLATMARELSGRRVVCVTHEDVMWTFRYRLEKLTIGEWLEFQEDEKHDIVNGGILHYTRERPDGSIDDRFHRVRRIDPTRPNEAAWTLIERPLLSSAELLAEVDQTPPLSQRSGDPADDAPGDVPDAAPGDASRRGDDGIGS